VKASKPPPAAKTTALGALVQCGGSGGNCVSYNFCQVRLWGGSGGPQASQWLMPRPAQPLLLRHTLSQRLPS
jgi:hypothetical protein